MSSNYTDVELLSKLNPGTHVQFSHGGESWTGMVLSGPIPNDVRGDTCVRLRCDQQEKTMMVPWKNVTHVESGEKR